MKWFVWTHTAGSVTCYSFRVPRFKPELGLLPVFSFTCSSLSVWVSSGIFAFLPLLKNMQTCYQMKIPHRVASKNKLSTLVMIYFFNINQLTYWYIMTVGHYNFYSVKGKYQFGGMSADILLQRLPRNFALKSAITHVLEDRVCLQ